MSASGVLKHQSPMSEGANNNDSVRQLFGMYHELNQKDGKPGNKHETQEKAIPRPDVSTHTNNNRSPKDAGPLGTSSTKRKIDDVDHSTGKNQNDDASSVSANGGKATPPPGKKKRFAWYDDLHRKFMAAIFDIGLRQAKPKAIFQSIHEPPAELTTEHIKSHLQKYRHNSKRYRDLFLEQFDVSKKQAEINNDGKALNPSFHAYPFPVGNFPIPESPGRAGSSLARSSSRSSEQAASPAHPQPNHVQTPSVNAFEFAASSSQRNDRPVHVHHHSQQIPHHPPSDHMHPGTNSSSSCSAASPPSPFYGAVQPHNNNSSCRSCGACSCGGVSRQALLMQERRKMELELERMNMQMELHKEIDQQHAFQQSKHLPQRGLDASMHEQVNNRPHASSFGDLSLAFASSPYLSAMEFPINKSNPTPLSLHDAVGETSSNDLAFAEDDLFDFLH